MIRMIFMISTLSHSISVAPLKRILSYKSKINYPEKIASSACQWHHIKPFTVLHVLEKITIAWQFPTALNLYLCFHTTANAGYNKSNFINQAIWKFNRC